MPMRALMKRAIKRLPYLRTLVEERDRLRAQLEALWVAPGHYDSPYPDIEEMRERQHEIFDCVPREVQSIDLNEKHQFELLGTFAAYYPELPYNDNSNLDVRYRFQNGLFCEHDAIVLYCMLRELRAARVVEIGSGFSSAGAGAKVPHVELAEVLVLALQLPGPGQAA